MAILVALPLGANATPWEQLERPSTQPTESIGSYANGCLAGAEALPLEGQGYQVIRSHRARYYAHSDAVDYIRQLGKVASTQYQTNLLIGDLSLPQGGRFSFGHSSHQTGLDIDIWLRLADQKLSVEELAEPKAMSVVHVSQYKLNQQNWDERHFGIVKQAASIKNVARIFVHPVIKQKLCDEERSADREWLRKIRPWWGHYSHMHVRLTCPEGSSNCQNQSLPPEGDGCGAELASWKPVDESDNSSLVRPPAKKKKPKVIPEQCQLLLENS
ncbi:penicillin-insensitive murein endopeptidase [Vibrio paucivorans]|uniref:Penicillin-insensitive murein endopeptidase n=1 Tax=Vibrio paucivorans TaxID=2829489 RepID=A0A9X3CAY3_9VIBR|nr:penicillin-insensitive murein endopeptidase [Vibrio paucivorans]MCW8332328.1 penicillin-insensitive murein endopeptidase [Vibrio paucivorans]